MKLTLYEDDLHELRALKIEHKNWYYRAIEILAYNYDLMAITEDYCLGNDCVARTYMYNGGSAYYELNDRDIVELISERRN